MINYESLRVFPRRSAKTPEKIAASRAKPARSGPVPRLKLERLKSRFDNSYTLSTRKKFGICSYSDELILNSNLKNSFDELIILY